jgi:membrane fusion protein, epimerase transport system
MTTSDSALSAAVTTTTEPARPMIDSLTQARRIRRLGWLLILGGIVPIGAWMALAPLSMAVVAPAHVKVDLNRRPVQHLEGGIVAKVLVRDGQKVRAGDPILELGTVAVDADRSRVALRGHAEQAAVARLEAERVSASKIDFGAALTAVARTDPRVAEVLRKEQSLFDSRRQALASEAALLRAQRQGVATEIESLRAEIRQAESALALQRTDLERSRGLLGNGYISATRVTQVEASVADYAAKLEERRSEVARAQQRAIEIDLKIKTARNGYVQAASDQLKNAVSRVAEVEQEQRKSDDAAKRQVVVAPVDGEVIDLKFTSAGAVVRAGEPIAEIVPSDAPLLIEARIRPEEINHVSQSLPARIKLLASRYRNSASIDGTVRYVSADRLIDRSSGQPYYLATIAADASALDDAAKPLLQAGMPVEVYIQGNSRTTLEYLVEPITLAMRRAARPL